MNLKNVTIFEGRITKDLELKQTTTGKFCCNYTVAVERPYVKGREKECDFISCVAWGKTAEFIVKYFTKGKPIKVCGSLRNKNYTDKNGVKHYTFEVITDTIDFPMTSLKEKTNSNYNEAPYPEEPPYMGDLSELGNLDDFEYVSDSNDIPY